MKRSAGFWIVAVLLGCWTVSGIIALMIWVASPKPANAPKSSSAPPTVSSAPIPLTPEQRKAQEKERQAQDHRIGTCSILEGELVKAGYNVHVGFVGQAGSTHMYIMGDPVNRVFIYQLTGAEIFTDFRRAMKLYGFTKITFMKSRTEWVGEYDVIANTIRTDPQ